MAVFHLCMLALIQGLTEFLPISSSGHLVLVPHLTGLPDHGQAIDVAVHVGTLGAVMVYYRSDVMRAANGFLRCLGGDRSSEDSRLFLALLVATVPVVIVGFLLRMTGGADMLRSVAVVAWATIVFAVVLFVCDRRPAPQRGRGSMDAETGLDSWLLAGSGTDTGNVAFGDHHIGRALARS